MRRDLLVAGLLTAALLASGTGCGSAQPLIPPPSRQVLDDLERSLATPPELLGVVPPRPVEGACPAPVFDPPSDFVGDLAAVARLRIDASGRVTGVEIVEPSALPGFDAAVMKTLATWRFIPATRDGVPLGCRQRVRVRHGDVTRSESTEEAGGRSP